MASRPLTPGETAATDQGMASLDQDLDRLARRIREQIAEFGEPQARANIALMLTEYTSAGENAGLLLAALMRLARETA